MRKWRWLTRRVNQIEDYFTRADKDLAGRVESLEERVESLSLQAIGHAKAATVEGLERTPPSDYDSARIGRKMYFLPNGTLTVLGSRWVWQADADKSIAASYDTLSGLLDHEAKL